MSNSNKDIERLVVRHLDGELSPDEEHELNCALIRDPDARQMQEDFARIDDLTVAALNDAVGDQGPEFDVAALTRKSQERFVGGYPRAWWIVPGAIAAALLLMVASRSMLIGQLAMDDSPAVPMVGRHTPLTKDAPIRNDSGLMTVRSRDRGAIVPVSTAATLPRIKRSTDREVFAVLGDDGNIYWIEVDRIRSMQRPSAWSTAHMRDGGL